MRCSIQHLRNRLALCGGSRLISQISTALDGERVHRDILRRKIQQSIHSLCKSIGSVSGQTGDQIHVDLVKARLPRLVKRAEHIGSAVSAADSRQNRIVHALRVDAHAANARAFEHAQLFRCDGIRTARFYSIFAQM